MAQLPCVSAARPLLAVPPSRGRWRGPRVRRHNAAGRWVAAGVRAAAGPVAAAVEAEVDDEDDDDDEEEVAVERYALGGACKVLAGMPAPLGATALTCGVNFAVYSGGASAASLCLFTPDDLSAVSFSLLPSKFDKPAVCYFVSLRPLLCHTLNRVLCRWNGPESGHRGGSASSQIQSDRERVARVYRGGAAAHHALRVQV